MVVQVADLRGIEFFIMHYRVAAVFLPVNGNASILPSARLGIDLLTGMKSIRGPEILLWYRTIGPAMP